MKLIEPPIVTWGSHNGTTWPGRAEFGDAVIEDLSCTLQLDQKHREHLFGYFRFYGIFPYQEIAPRVFVCAIDYIVLEEQLLWQ